MNVKFPSRMIPVACGFILASHALVAQTQIQLFGPIDTRNSPTSATYAAPDTVSSTTLTLTSCPANPTAVLSGPLMNGGGTAPASPLQAGGNLLVDNNIFVTVTAGATTNGPTNICVGGVNQGGSYNGQTVPPNDQANCFASGYAGYATSGSYPPGPLNGDSPDTTLVPPPYGSNQTVDASGGVPPINITSLLVPGQTKQIVTISLMDEGGILTSSSLFLQTNCQQGGVTGPATVSGNPITTETGQGLTQSFTFDAGNGQTVGLVYDLSEANGATTLSNDGAIPQVADLPLAASLFQADAIGTSFATSNCLVHTGELLSDGVTPACKLYTLACTNNANSNEAGANCPVSAYVDEVIQDVFDGPPFTLQNIYTSNGIFRQGIGLLMASDTWPGTNSSPAPGPCQFDPDAGPVANLPCPQNLLDSFNGPGGFSGSGLTTNPNSTFISIYGVPQDLTTVWVNGEWPDNWVNTHTQKVNFYTQSPNFSSGAYTWNGSKFVALPGASSYVPAPIKGVTYGVTAPNAVPLPVNEASLSDTFLDNSAVNCTTGYAPPSFTAKTEPNFSATQTLNLSDGQYVLHYYAADCAGTQELKFTEAPVTLSWSTNFFTYPINVDTKAPTISNLKLSVAAPTKGQIVNATYTCTDTDSSGNPNTGSGLVLCGTNIFAPQTDWSSNGSTRIDTSSTGNKSFVVYAADGAGNTSSATINYTVAK